MAIEVTEAWSDSTSELDIRGRSARRSFDVTGTSDPFVVLAQPDIPTLDAPHPGNANLRVTSIAQPERLGPQYFRVAVEYAQGSQVGFGNEDDPLSRAPVYDWNLGITTEQFDRDIDGNPIVNSAGDPYGDAVQGTVHSITLDVTRNEASFDPAWALGFSNKINAGTWSVAGKTVGEGQAKCLGIVPDPYTLADSYVSVRYLFELRADGFKTRVLDSGYQASTNFAGTQATGVKTGHVSIVGPDGERATLTTPTLLNGTGIPIRDDVDAPEGYVFASRLPPKGAEIEDLGDAVYLKYRRHEAVDFNALQL